MATPRASWGIEIGADAIKAIRLERDGDRAEVVDFAVIPHKKVLTTPDLDQDEMVRLSLGQFISQKSLEGEHLVMSVPGHAAFARFAKLPPVEPKKVPDIVKFEAVQQIPFPIDEVEWDYQTFTTDDSPEVEVGIFAITRERVQQRLGLYSELGVSPESLTLSPVAVFNALTYDLDLTGKKGPVVLLDIGTQATDVVIAEEGRCWIRTFPLGGTHFTEAIANAFKLSYSKAEKLKKEASTSKYAKQIMQAMRPVFSDLLQDLQRSIGYYQSLHREAELETMIGIGSTFKIPGLRKFIGQQLQINVHRLDEFKKIAVTGREAASFAENTVNMATAYGLALQGIGLAEIDANLVPVKALREHMWHAKTKWFAAAAAITVAGAATMLYHPLMDGRRLEPTAPREVAQVLQRGERFKTEFEQAQSSATIGHRATNMMKLTAFREVWPYLVNDVAESLASTKPQPELFAPDIEKTLAIPPDQRRLVMLEELGGDYVPPGLDEAGQPAGRRIRVTMNVELSHDRPIRFLNESVAQWLRDNAEPEGDRADVPYRILTGTVSCNPERLQPIDVTEDGERAAAGESRGGARPPSGLPTRPPTGTGSAPPPVTPPTGSGGQPGGGVGGRRQPPAQPRQPPGARGGGGLGGSGGGGGGTGRPGGGIGGRRQPPAQPRQPPGAMGGGGGLGGGPGGTGGAGIPRPPAGGNTSSRGSGDLDAIAPITPAPSIYPAGSRYYRVPVTFVVEILDPKKPDPAGDQTARDDREEESQG